MIALLFCPDLSEVARAMLLAVGVSLAVYFDGAGRRAV
jgi:hypothetical protein